MNILLRVFRWVRSSCRSCTSAVAREGSAVLGMLINTLVGCCRSRRRRRQLTEILGWKTKTKTIVLFCFASSFCICALGSLGFFGAHFVVGALSIHPTNRPPFQAVVLWLFLLLAADSECHSYREEEWRNELGICGSLGHVRDSLPFYNRISLDWGDELLQMMSS